MADCGPSLFGVYIALRVFCNRKDALAAFFGALLVMFGVWRLADHGCGFAVGILLTAVQALALGFMLVAQITVTAWLTSAAYAVAGYAALVLSAAIPAAFAAAVWKSFPQWKVPMLLLSIFSLIGAVSAMLIPGIFLMRLIPGVAGAAMLVWLGIQAYREI